MNAVELKSDLHKLIEKATDISILQAVKVILTKESMRNSDWADTLSESLKNELEASIKEADQGKKISHKEAMQRIKKRYNH